MTQEETAQAETTKDETAQRATEGASAGGAATEAGTTKDASAQADSTAQSDPPRAGSADDAETPRVTPERIMQFVFAFAPPLVIEAAVRNGVFDALDGRQLTAEEVGAATGASVRGLRALMNALVGLNFLDKDGRERYCLTPESAAFLVAGRPGFVGGIFRHVSRHMLPMWVSLSDAVRTGLPAAHVNREAFGAQFFSEFVEDIFPSSYPSALALAEGLRLSSATEIISVLDLAAGSGSWGVALAQSSSQVRVTAVDWAGVIPVTRRVAERHGVADRFTFVEGDLREADFGANHHIATLGHILHSEGEERGRALLRKTFDALAPGGRVVVAEWLVSEDRKAPLSGLVFALNMLVSTERGDTFTFKEIDAWLGEAGFEPARTLDAPGPSPLIIARKPGP